MSYLISALGLVLMSLGLSEAVFNNCDFKYNLNADSTALLQSPYFPDRYNPVSSCRYQLFAPMDYEILAQCDIAMDMTNGACGTEYFYVATDGELDLTGADQTCGTGSLTYVSQFRSLVIAFTSNPPAGSDVGGSFNCTLTVRPKACDCGWSKSTRIVGGEDAELAEFPSMVGLYSKSSNSLFCSGSILNHYTILSATHCKLVYSNAEDYIVKAGDLSMSSNTESRYAANYTVNRFIELPGYDAENNINDLMLIITNEPIEWSAGVGPVCLPFDQINNTFDFQTVYSIGWGTTEFAGAQADILQKAELNFLTNSACSSVYPTIAPTQVCTYYPGRDACQFDSGGPVIYKGTSKQWQLGIIISGNGCGSEPGVNTRITSFLDWIESELVGTVCRKPFS